MYVKKTTCTLNIVSGVIKNSEEVMYDVVSSHLDSNDE